MLAFPCAQQVPGKGLITVRETIKFTGSTHLIHPFYTDHKALLHMDKIIKEASDIIMISHTKDNVPFFLPTARTSVLLVSPNFGGGSARHITFITTFRSPGTLGLPASYAEFLERTFQHMTFNLDKPMNLPEVLGFRDSGLHDLQNPSELVWSVTLLGDRSG
jgi:hypothetical protein